MRNISYVLLVFSVIGLLFSCKGKTKSTEQLRDEMIIGAEMDVQSSDTVQVKHLTDMYLSYIKNGNLDGAMQMLYFLDKDSITAVPEDLAKRERQAMSMFVGKKVFVSDIRFLRETDSQVRCNVILFDKEPGDTRPNTVSFFLKPVRRSGQWYLTLADTETSNYTQSASGTDIEN